MTVMVCLLSDQHVPNLLTVHEIKPDYLFLIETPAMMRRNAALNFMNALDIGGIGYLQSNDRYKVVSLSDENSIQSALDIFQDIISKYPEDQWYINITGGTKLMSIAAFEFFKDRSNCVMLYVPINQTKALKFIGKKEFTQGDKNHAVARPNAFFIANEIEPLSHKVSIGQFLAGYGFELTKSASEIEDVEKLALKWFETSAYIVANHSNPNVISFLTNFTKISNERKGRKDGLVLQDSDKLDLKDKPLLEKITTIFPSISVINSNITGHLNATEVEFLTGGWLEVFVWASLSNHSDELGIRDVRLNLEIRSKYSSEPRPKNEWDVTFMQDQSLCFVECKTGNQKRKKGEDILYKVEAIKKHLVALRVKSFFATTSPIVIDKTTGRIYEHLATRSALYNCKIIVGEELQKIGELQLKPIKAGSEIVKQIATTFNLGKVVRN